ncbi:DNL zinc finger-domain-containing protein [Annulohypoxylon truncatum]|uniref:DNL zinc finger-domain-containing protein n=1 Tax=Annulohypoxylon truncatum TaxID=327061 RepID=UPI00200795BA|nr:DNL zinc finger-domain-containing protein [Annulohypoxylon truncatum]KAI1204248.1 DNL zinc finger-domain-containing protein [Annulohypoxylon truncatum]
MASKPVAGLLINPILRRSKIIPPSILHPYPLLPRTLQPAARRFAHTIPKPPGHPKTPSEQQRARRLAEYHYQLTFTCVPCNSRSTHEVSKTGYHYGSVLITCPECRNRHIISDHLNIFGDRDITVEDLMREKGQLVRRGHLGETGDVEFWEDKDFDAEDTRPESAEAQDHLDKDVSEEEEAARSRETRDPSSQATEPKPTASAPLGDGGARPSIGNSQHTNPAPSTRRQLSTASAHDSFGASLADDNIYQLSNSFMTGPRTRHLQKLLRKAIAERRSVLSQVPKEEMLQKTNVPRERQ